MFGWQCVVVCVVAVIAFGGEVLWVCEFDDHELADFALVAGQASLCVDMDVAGAFGDADGRAFGAECGIAGWAGEGAVGAEGEVSGAAVDGLALWGLQAEKAWACEGGVQGAAGVRERAGAGGFILDAVGDEGEGVSVWVGAFDQFLEG